MGQECSCQCGDGKSEMQYQEVRDIMENNSLMQEQIDQLE